MVTAQATGAKLDGHGGDVALGALLGFGVAEMFTLSGGHVFPLYDAAVRAGVRIVDVRHEPTAVFAAEGLAKLTRRPGLAVVTAGPGVTNAVSGVTTAYFSGSPVVLLGGRAPTVNWGRGGLQELDHVPILAPVTKHASTATSTGAIGAEVRAAVLAALTPHRGPAFVDIPMDLIFAPATAELPPAEPPRGPAPDPDEVLAAARLLAAAERPAIIAGTDVYWEGAWDALRQAAEALRVPVFANGLGRGCLPADHELAFARTRGLLRREADLVLVIGTPLDFRLGFGDFGAATVLHAVDHPSRRATHARVALAPAGDLGAILAGLAGLAGAPRADHEPWLARLRAAEDAARAAEQAQLDADTDPIKPARVYGELRRRLARDAVLIGDGGDFVSYAGKYLDSYQPGCWLDPGPYGCLGTGLGYAIAARVARPSSQVVLMLGDGAAGMSLMDVDTLVRHQLPAVIVVGNNGGWGLEKHPMRAIYGYDVAADLRADTRYDEVAAALGGAGETVERAADLGPALDRAFAAGVPYLLNVRTDPADAYPRSSVLA
ncbi:MAG TPA: acetolactate synthase [Mycobacteriales bacterium]|nr:acetolactate synthase [Mycobacteriales bacterium]